MLNLLLIACIIVFIVDLSGVTQSISEFIWNRLNKGLPYRGWIIPKPFSCSLCMTFWIGLVWLYLNGWWTITGVAFVCLLAFLTSTIKDILITIKDYLDYILELLSKARR